MKTVSISEATGPVLDFLVAKCEGINVERGGNVIWPNLTHYSPSTDWARGGPIIARENITIVSELFKYTNRPHKQEFDAYTGFREYNYGCRHEHHMRGINHLEAAMRVFVFSRAGGIHEVPEELLC